MSYRSMLPHRVTIVHPAYTTNSYNNEQKDWDGATRDRDVRARVTQARRTEFVDGREALITDWTLFLLPDALIAGADRVEWSDGAGDLTFEVVGRPNRATGRRGVHHVEVSILLVEG